MRSQKASGRCGDKPRVILGDARDIIAPELESKLRDERLPESGNRRLWLDHTLLGL